MTVMVFFNVLFGEDDNELWRLRMRTIEGVMTFSETRLCALPSHVRALEGRGTHWIASGDRSDMWQQQERCYSSGGRDLRLQMQVGVEWFDLVREEKAEADIVIVTLKVTYQCVCEGKLRKKVKSKENEKSSNSA